MHKYIKILILIFSFILVLHIVPINSTAKEYHFSIESFGGWSEDGGDWSNSELSRAANKPEKHWAVITQKVAGGVVYTKVTAHTEWKGVYHYSRARFEGVFGVEGDSGRVWRSSKTKASSDWVDKRFSVAKTYWGK